MFQGMSEETYRFFWDLAFHNDRSFFDANRDRYKTVVYKPLCALTDALAPAIADIDDRLSTRYTQVISHIHRDTRYTKDKSPYRDHAWLAFRMPGVRTGAGFVIYAEFERESYGYGMGMYAPITDLMQELRNRMLARPQKFLSLVSEPEFAKRFTLQGEAFKRPRYQDAPEAIRPYLNMRSLSFCFSSPDLKRTCTPALADEIAEGFALLKPVYRFLQGLE